MLIKTHKQLAELIAGKTILHQNSLGKDSVLCLEWLTRASVPARIVSVNFEFMAKHPDDDRYLNYLIKRFPQIEFIKVPNAIELTNIAQGVLQCPMQILKNLNHFEFDGFKTSLVAEELKKKYNADYICDGQSKYESFARTTKFYNKGLEFKGYIYPLGMMTKAQVYDLIRKTGIKLHPQYKTTKSTYDYPSYWKMRNGLVANPKYKESVYKVWPLLRLDEYRYEKLL